MSAATQLRKDAEAIAEQTPLVVTHDTLAAALVAALKGLTVVGANHTADAGSYSYDYADLADIVSLTRPRLALHGIVALTPVHAYGTGLACTVTLLHTSGERMDCEPFPFPHGRDAQATGSMVTYHRRYALLAALGMATGDDDDGASAKAAQPAFVWTRGAVKARLLELLDKNEAAAKEAWTNGHGDDLTEFSAAAADRLAALWRENQPAEPALPLGDES